MTATRLGARDRARIREAIRRRGGNCYVCGGDLDWNLPRTDPMAVEIDHVIPLAAGGSNDLENLRACHKFENRSKSKKTDWIPTAIRTSGSLK